MGVESQAANQIPWESPVVPIGMGGLNLAKPITQLTPEECARLTNAVPRQGGGLDTRPGLTFLAGGGTNWHSALRLNDARTGGFTRFWGVDGSWLRGASGAPTIIDGGFSGNPLSQVSAKPKIATRNWVYVADTNKMRKASATDGSRQIGLPKPAIPITQTQSFLTTTICNFNAANNSAAANWTFTAGVDRSATPAAAGAPSGTDAPGIAGNTVIFQTAPGGAQTGYSSIFGLPFMTPLDLTTLQGGAFPASDDDIIHTWIRIDHPELLEEIRVYLVVSDGFVPSIIPGTDPGGQNPTAYWKAFTPSDFTAAIQNLQSSQGAATNVRSQDTLRNYLFQHGGIPENDPNFRDDVAQNRLAQRDLSRVPTQPLNPGSGIWTEQGQIGVPLRRGDFTKIGASGGGGSSAVPGFLWKSVTGLIIVIQTALPKAVQVSFNDFFLTGGSGPDSTEPGAAKYDWRVTNFDPATGAESNPSDVQSMALRLDALRQAMNVIPAASGAVPGVRQRIYRRGGTLVDNWYFLGVNTGDGALFSDTFDDLTAFGGGTLAIDNDQPVTTVDSANNTLLAQPLRVLVGPIDDILFGMGDKNRPGDLYWSKPGMYDSWPAANHVYVCPPSEELMNGVRWGGQGIVFSRERAYAIQVNPLTGSIFPQPTDCSEGLAGYWGICTCPLGIAFVAADGVRVMQGGQSRPLSDNIRPLFHNQTINIPNVVNGYQPIDWTHPERLRLAYGDNDLWFGYQDTAGNLLWMVYSFIYQNWRNVKFAIPTNLFYREPMQTEGLLGALVIGASAAGKVYTHQGQTDDGTAIACNYRSGAVSFGRSEEKLLGAITVGADMKLTTLTETTYINDEQIVDNAFTIAGLSGPRKYVFEPFGTNPQHARNISIDLTWGGSLTDPAGPVINWLNVSYAIQPEITMNRATTWEPLQSGTDVYLKGCWVDCDTFNSPRTVLVETMLDGVLSIISVDRTLVVNSGASRQRLWFSWAFIHADMVRLRPTGACAPWQLFNVQWISDPLPPRMVVWDTNFEELGDSFFTGVDLVADTFGNPKTVNVTIDGVTQGSFPINSNGKKWFHLTFDVSTPVRGHIGRIFATDNLYKGLLYKWEWVKQPEPKEQWNLNQGIDSEGTLADKWVKGMLLQMDSFGQPKTIKIEVDGAVLQTITATAIGRNVVNITFPQVLGRLVRVYAIDTNPVRVYDVEWLFDEEPYGLTRWETQELTLGANDFKFLLWGDLTIKSTFAVNLQILTYGATGLLVATDNYTLLSTGNLKQTLFVPFNGRKGYLYKFIFTSNQVPASQFWLYREETVLWLQPLRGGQVQSQRPFGDDDLDLVRSMQGAQLTASRGGGGEAR